MKLLLILNLALTAACVHTRDYRQQDSDRHPRAEVTQKNQELQLSVFWDVKPGEIFEFSAAPVLVTYSDGTQIPVQPQILMRQFRLHVEEKYPPKEGYHALPTGHDWVYRVIKDEKHFGVSTEKKIAIYDATPKEEPLEVNRAYRFSEPEDGYVRRSIYLKCAFPNKTNDFTVALPHKNQTIHFHYVDKWEPIRLAP